jgi:hypothetical protein
LSFNVRVGIRLLDVRRYGPPQQLTHSLPSKRLSENGDHVIIGMGTPSNGLFGKRGDKNDWDAASLCDQAILKIEAAQAGHLHIADEAGAVVHSWRTQEIFGGFKSEGDETERPHEALDGGADRRVIIDNRNDLRPRHAGHLILRGDE